MSARMMWQPSAERRERARLTAFMALLRERYGQAFPDYHSLWRWSLANKAVFWREVWEFCRLKGDLGARDVIDGHLMPGAQWFPDARLNFAENQLVHDDVPAEQDALVFYNERGVSRRLSWAALREQTAQMQQALQAMGVGEGDRVASLLPMVPEATVAFLGATSLGAVWSAASPDFGVQGVHDRFQQIAPKVLFAVNGYYYNGKLVDTREKVLEVASKLPGLERLVWLPYVDLPVPLALTNDMAATSSLLELAVWSPWLDAYPADFSRMQFPRFPFSQPLVIAYSSGTTGLPKGIVQSAGGMLLQLSKEHALHGDVRLGDRLFYFTTTGWVMWNWSQAALSVGATCLLYDGSPFADRGDVLWAYAEREQATHFGSGAKYFDVMMKTGVVPRREHAFPHLRTLFSTGSPLQPETFDYLYECIHPDLHVASIAGGTDLMSCFALGNPLLPVYRGELQCRGLGMAVDVFDENGRSLAPPPGVEGEMGELVCTQSFPAMPLRFWGDDAEDSRYRAAYFEFFPGVWRHGDWCQITANDGLVIVGRSDTTLNPKGVRIGTAEIYREVERLPEVIESVAIGQSFDGDTRIVLFVRLADGVVLDDALIERIKRQIADNTTPRHVPAKIVQVPDIPRTRSNKLLELAVRDVVHGRTVKNTEAVANPEALEYFRNRPELSVE